MVRAVHESLIENHFPDRTHNFFQIFIIFWPFLSVLLSLLVCFFVFSAPFLCFAHSELGKKWEKIERFDFYRFRIRKKGLILMLKISLLLYWTLKGSYYVKMVTATLILVTPLCWWQKKLNLSPTYSVSNTRNIDVADDDRSHCNTGFWPANIGGSKLEYIIWSLVDTH